MNDTLVYDGWLKICQRRIGNTTYDILGDYCAAAAIITDEARNVLLVEQFRPALMKHTLEIPAGTLDNNMESKTECLSRELREEANLIVRPEEIKPVLSYLPNIGFSNSFMSVFFLRLDGEHEPGEISIEHDDVIKAYWVNMDDFAKIVARGEILDIKTLIAFWYLKNNIDCSCTGFD